MAQPVFRIGAVAASSRFDREIAERVAAHVAARWPDGSVEVLFHPDAFLHHGHFAGDDACRTRAFLDYANDPTIDAVWFARGGYGSNRMAAAALAGLSDAAQAKPYLGYSDAGFLMAGLYRLGCPNVAHGPMAGDIRRPDGAVAVDRALDWLIQRDPAGLEPHLDDRPAVAFNLTVLSCLMGTPLEPDLSGHVLMLEDVAEPLYRIDRAMFHLSSQPGFRRLAGVRIGRVTETVENDPDFEQTADDIVRHWCGRAGVEVLGQADIGHDAANRIVPFGLGARAPKP